MTVRSLRAVHADLLARMTGDEQMGALVVLDSLLDIHPRHRQALTLAIAALEAADCHGRGGTRASDVLWNEE